MPYWAHQRQLSYQPKQEREFTQNLEWTPDNWDDWRANNPAPSSGDTRECMCKFVFFYLDVLYIEIKQSHNFKPSDSSQIGRAHV